MAAVDMLMDGMRPQCGWLQSPATTGLGMLVVSAAQSPQPSQGWSHCEGVPVPIEAAPWVGAAWKGHQPGWVGRWGRSAGECHSGMSYASKVDGKHQTGACQCWASSAEGGQEKSCLLALLFLRKAPSLSSTRPKICQ